MRSQLMRAAAGAILAVLAAVAQHDHDEPETFDSILNTVIRASRERLRPLKTFRIEQRPSNNYWYEVTESLPGAECRIFEHPRMVYQCTWTTAKDGPANPEALVAEISKAAPERYEVTRNTRLTSFHPREPHRYPVMEVTGDRAAKTGLQLRIYPVSRD